MPWIIYVLVAEIFWSSGNYIDKYLVSNYLKGVGVGSLVIFSSLIAVFVIPIAYLFDRNIFELSNIDILILIISGVIFATTWIVPYFYALADEDASIVVPIFQLVPVFNYILGLLFLDEQLAAKQVFGIIIIVIGAMLISFNLEKFHFKWKLLSFMIISSLSVAIANLLFKFVSVEQISFSVSIFWENIGILLVAIVYFVFVGSYRRQFINVLKNNKSSIIALNSFNEILNTVAKACMYFASLKAPLALVWVAGAVQPVLMILIGFILSLIIPKYINENFSKKAMVQKLIAMGIMFVGVLFIFL